MKENELKITPKCCKEVQEKQSILLSYLYSDDVLYGPEEEENVKASKRKKMYERHKPVWVVGSWNSSYNCWGTTEAQFCPHCSKPLPEIKRRKTKRKIRSITDGSYYCDTCSLRLMECQCLAPEYAWELEE